MIPSQCCYLFNEEELCCSTSLLRLTVCVTASSSAYEKN